MARKPGTWRGIRWLTAATLVATSGLLAQTQTTQRYLITDLGTLGGASSEATGVNSLGDVVGFSTTAAGAPHAFLYRTGRMLDLGTLPGGSASHATAISDNGVVVGYSGINGYGPQFREFIQGFVWENGEMRALGALYCPCSFNVRYGTSRAFAVSGVGRIVGDSGTQRATFTHAFLWQSNAMRDLVAEEDGASNSVAYGINDLDEVVGEIDGTAFYVGAGITQDLGVLPGHATSRARAVNITGQVVGDSITAGGIAHAFLWDRRTLRNLGTLPGDVASEARAINLRGQAIGRSGSTDFSTSHAVVWQGGAAVDLNTLISVTDWVLTSATGINDVGQIVGVGLRGGQVRAFMLNPQ